MFCDIHDVTALTFDHSGNWLAWGGCEGALGIIYLSCSNDRRCLADGGDPDGKVDFLKYHRDNLRLCSMDISRVVRVFNVHENVLIFEFEEGSHPVGFGDELYLTERRMFIAGRHGYSVVDLDTHEYDWIEWTERLSCWCSTISTSGEWVMTACMDGGMRLMHQQPFESHSINIDPDYFWFVDEKCIVFYKGGRLSIDCGNSPTCGTSRNPDGN